MNLGYLLPAGSLLCAAICAVYDVRSRRIPNFITLPAFAVGLILHAVLGGWRQFFAALAGGLICGAAFFIFYAAGGMGAGDVKLISAAGCLVGLPLVPPLLLFTALAGGVMAIFLALSRRQLRATLENTLAVVAHHRILGLTPHPRLNVNNGQLLRLPYALAIMAGCGFTLCSLVIQR